MRWIALALSFVVALAILPAGIRALREAGMTRDNYRGASVAFPLGAVLLAASLVALAPLAVLDDRADINLLSADLRRWFAYIVGIAFLGLFDDTIGRGASSDTPRGWRGHMGAVMRGELSSGAIKALGALALAAYATSGLGREWFGYLVDLAILLLATNMWNLLDLRPGRAEKALVLLGAGLCIGYWTFAPIELLGLFLGPILVGAAFTLREEAMLGDTGSNLIGAVAGVWMLETLSDPARYVALGVLVLLTIYGEFRSISSTIDRVPLLKHLDSLGRS